MIKITKKERRCGAALKKRKLTKITGIGKMIINFPTEKALRRLVAIWLTKKLPMHKSSNEANTRISHQKYKTISGMKTSSIDKTHKRGINLN